MKSYSSREVMKMLIADGWYEVNTVGSHHQFKHPIKKRKSHIKAPIEKHTAQNTEKYFNSIRYHFQMIPGAYICKE